MRFDPGIFQAYDIRGAVPARLDENFARALGQAYGTLARRAGEAVVAVGRDGRRSGPALSAALIEGLRASGVDVIDVGLVTTPMLWFAACTLARTGIQVTASHNPKHHNGFKMVLAGQVLFGERIQAVRRMMEAGDFERPAAPGALRHADVFADYRARITGEIRLARPLKIVLDCGNGVGGAWAPAIFRAIGCAVVEMYTEVDGDFPNHHPDPSKPENLRELIARVRQEGADVGLALDGDGDRLGVVAPSGNIIYPDRQMMLFARDVLARRARRSCSTSSARSAWGRRSKPPAASR